VATFIPPYDLGNTKYHRLEFDLTKAPVGITKVAVTLTEDNATGFSKVKNLFSFYGTEMECTNT